MKLLKTNIASILTIAALFSSIATYYAISDGFNNEDPNTTQILTLLSINIILLLALVVFVANKITALWLARKRGSAGSRLQTRIVIMFSLVSIIPTGIIAVFSIFYSIFVIQGWFSERVGIALEESVKVSEGYLDEHRSRIRNDGLTIANYLNSQYERFKEDPKIFGRDVSTQARLLAVNEAMVFRKQDLDAFGKTDVLAKTQLSFTLESQISYLKKKRPELLERADNGEVVTYISPHTSAQSSDKILSLLKLYRFNDAYLLVGRFVDSNILKHMETSKGAVHEYRLLKRTLTGQQIQLGIMFVIVALLLLLAALWIGINFAGKFVNPISDLIKATEQVKAGNLDTRIEDGPKDDEMSILGRAFNRMTEQLQKHNNEMLEINKIIDNRRRFTEDVLSGVSAGIIALDSDQNVTLFNRTSPQLLSIDAQQMKGQSIESIFPEVVELIKRVIKSSEQSLQQEVPIVRDGKSITLLSRVVREDFSDQIEGFIVTFDDITELQSAQRSAAWSDVARRIAHEIKNPLTPIHLATERLRKKYGKDLDEDDAEMFNRYLDTIIRHVGSIGNIVEEFVSFARMPSPTLRKEDITPIIKEVVASQELAHPDVKFQMSGSASKNLINADAGQISQLFTNLIKNAAEAFENIEQESKEVTIKISDGDYLNIEIIDNGNGFKEDLIQNITEPYVTTKEKGTGLGLAIVSKIISDHNGRLKISNLHDEAGEITGACVSISLPR